MPRYKLNIWDVGGQKTLRRFAPSLEPSSLLLLACACSPASDVISHERTRSYWRNYFEATDGMVWVIDSADRCIYGPLSTCPLTRSYADTASSLFDCGSVSHPQCPSSPHALLTPIIAHPICRRRLGDCAEELQNLLVQEKLAGASLLVFANKQVARRTASAVCLRASLSVRLPAWSMRTAKGRCLRRERGETPFNGYWMRVLASCHMMQD